MRKQVVAAAQVSARSSSVDSASWCGVVPIRGACFVFWQGLETGVTPGH